MLILWELDAWISLGLFGQCLAENDYNVFALYQRLFFLPFFAGRDSLPPQGWKCKLFIFSSLWCSISDNEIWGKVAWDGNSFSCLWTLCYDGTWCWKPRWTSGRSMKGPCRSQPRLWCWSAGLTKPGPAWLLRVPRLWETTWYVQGIRTRRRRSRSSWRL